MDFPKKQQQCLIPRYLLQYLTSLQTNHDDPTAPWGGGGGGTYTAGDGIEISDEDVISIDDTVALKSDIPSLTGYATETWVTNQGYLVQSDLSDYVTSSELITELGNYVTSTDLATELLNYAELDDIPTKTSDLTNDSGFITSSALTGYATESWVTNQGYSTFSGSYSDLTNKPDLSIYELAADAFSGDYNDLTNKPTIPVVPTNISSFTNDAGYITSSALSNYVTTNTNQDITGVKTFVGRKMIKFKQLYSTDKLGFTGYDNNNNEVGYLEMNKSDNDFGSKTSNVLGIYDNSNAASDKYVGFKYYKNKGSDNNKHVVELSVPPLYANTNSGSQYIRYIPIDFTDGTNTVRSDATGVINISSLLPTIPDAVSGTNDGTNWTSLTIGSDTYGLASGSTPANMVTTDTDQDIDGVKTFLDRSVYLTERNTITNTSSTNISFSEANQSSTRNIGALVAHHNRLRFNGDSASSELYYTAISDMGYAQESYAGFYVSGDTLYDKLFVAPHPSFSAGWDSAYPDHVYYIPMVISDGTTNYYANEQGIVTIPTGGSSYTAGTGIDITNDVISIDSTVVTTSDLATVATTGAYSDLTGTPTLATVATSGSYADLSNKPSIPSTATSTSTSTVTPSTIQLTFTFEDDTTQTVTLMTGATVSTTTTTTLS